MAGAGLSYICGLLHFPGLWGMVTGVSVFLALWLIAWLILKGDTFVMDAKGEKGAFESRLSNYLDIAKFVLGLASGSVVLLVGSTTFHEGGIRLPHSYASPLFLLVFSIIWGILFMVLETLDYMKPSTNPSSTRAASIREILRSASVVCFAFAAVTFG